MRSLTDGSPLRPARRPPRPARRPLRLARGVLRTDKLVLGLVALLVLLLVGYPIVFVVLRALSVNGVGSSLTLHWFAEFAADSYVRDSILSTIELIAGGLVLALIGGTTLAFLRTRTDMPLPGLATFAAVFPLLIPPFMLVIGWIMLTSPRIGFLNQAIRAVFGLSANAQGINIYTIWGMIWTLGLYLTPYVYLLVSAGFRALDPSLEDAARTSGAPWRTVLRVITLPMLKPVLLAAVLLALVLGTSEFIIPTTLGESGGISVLSTAIWSEMNTFPSQPQLASAQGTLLVVVGVVCLFIQRRLVARGGFGSVTGKGFRPSRINLGRWRWVALIAVIGYLLVASVLPLAAIILTSLLRFWTTSLSAHDLTLSNYSYVLFHYPQVWTSVRNSLFLAIVGATVGILLSLILTWIVHRSASRLRYVVSYATILPLGVPGVVLAVGMLTAWISIPVGLYGTIWLMLLAYITGYLPIGMQATTGAFHQVARELEESARVAGASWGQAMRIVIGPLIRPALVGGWLLLYVLMLRDISLSVLLYTPKTIVLSVGLLDIFDEGYYTQLAAYSMILFVLSALPLVLLGRFARPAYQRTSKGA